MTQKRLIIRDQVNKLVKPTQLDYNLGFKLARVSQLFGYVGFTKIIRGWEVEVE